MNQWSRSRKRIILLIIIFVLVVLIGLPLFYLFYQAPSCNDLRQNGEETGVDCGGSCQLLCTADSLPLVLKGDPQVLSVRDNTFEVVAMVENPNTNGEIYRVGYIIKLYVSTSVIPIKVIAGETYVPRGKTFAIFEGPFNFEEGVSPIRAVLEWKEETILWQKNTKRIPELLVKDLVLSREDTTPRLDANIENVSLENVSNIDLVALIYNQSGSIFAASKTSINKLPVGGKAPAVFTWPKPFNESILDIDVVVRILPMR